MAILGGFIGGNSSEESLAESREFENAPLGSDSQSDDSQSNDKPLWKRIVYSDKAVYVGVAIVAIVVIILMLEYDVIETDAKYKISHWGNPTNWSDGFEGAEDAPAAVAETVANQAASNPTGTDGEVAINASENTTYSAVGKAVQMKENVASAGAAINPDGGVDIDQLLAFQLTSEDDRKNHRRWAAGERPFTGGANEYIQIADERLPGTWVGMNRPRFVAATDSSPFSTTSQSTTRQHYNSTRYEDPLVFGTTAGIYDQ